METTNDDGASDARDGVTDALDAIIVTAQQGSPSEQQPHRTPTELFNIEMEGLLDNGKLPALNILLRGVPARFNYQTTMHPLIPMAFGIKGKAHLRP